MAAQSHGHELERIFPGNSEMAGRMRSYDWSQTALGVPEGWPLNLRTCARIILSSRQPMFIWWGKELIHLYNDGYKAILGGKHPAALGQPAPMVWSEVWNVAGPRAELAMSRDEGTYDEALPFIMLRNGYPEETYVTFSYNPIPDDRGGFGGILCPASEDTQRIIGERQLALLRELPARSADARTWQDACRLSTRAMETDPNDFPFALIYTIDRKTRSVSLAAAYGAAGIDNGAEKKLTLDNPALWPLDEVFDKRRACLVSDLSTVSDALPLVLGYPVRQAIAVPIALSGEVETNTVLVAGVNPLRPLDENYRSFLEMVAAGILAAMVNAESYEAERRRAEALAELDRATPPEMQGADLTTRLEAHLPKTGETRQQAALFAFQNSLPRVLLADDNADMREYVGRLLSGRYQVEAVSDGLEAFKAARERTPDLVLTGAMMPRLDGFGLLKALRADERLKTVPVILLSARAGEEASLEGIESGADDYLIKPFSARELVARVDAHLKMAGVRSEGEKALRESEQRLRLLVDNVQEYALVQTDSGGKLISWNRGAERLFGYSPADILGDSFSRLLHVDDRQAGVLERELACVLKGVGMRDERWLARKDGSQFWAQSMAEPVLDETGRVRGVVKVIRDETERKRSEERQSLLLGELNHRVKNTLATVQSMASQTLRGSTDPQQFVEKFKARLQALSRAHNLLTQRSWESADVNDLVHEQLTLGGDIDRITVKGPTALLSAQSAVALSLVLHELGTNARKYGALASPTGRLDVHWRIGAPEPMLLIYWAERGGPPVAQPQKRGFGTTLIEKSLGGVGGAAELQFHSGGLHCAIQIPFLPKKNENGSRGDVG